jgi:hypothetical protein
MTESHITYEDLPADQVLTAAADKLSGVVVIGYTKEDEEEYFASSFASSEQILWLIERLKKYLLEVSQ